MSGLTDYGANALLDGTPLPATLYAQLHKGDPGATGTTNVSVLCPARSSFTRSAAVSRSAANAADTAFAEAIAGTAETIVAVSFWDASTGGNCWATTSLTEALSLIAGVLPSFLAGSLVVRLP